MPTLFIAGAIERGRHMQGAAGLCCSVATPWKSYAGLLGEACVPAPERLMSQALFHIELRAPKYVSGIFRNCYDYSP